MPVVYLTTNLINNRKYIGVDKNNNIYYYGSGKAIKKAIKKYGINNFKKEILEYNDDIKYIYEREKYWINEYNAVNSKEFYNISEGGKGGNMLITEDSIKKWNEGIKKSIEINSEKRKGKNYEEIYGERSDEEKEKRSLAGLGKKYSKERCEKISESLKGKPVWNKGLTKDDNRVKKYIDNRLPKIFLKIYILYIDDKIEIEFEGKKKLENYIKNNINNNLNLKNRINVDKLIKNGEDKNMILKIDKRFK